MRVAIINRFNDNIYDYRRVYNKGDKIYIYTTKKIYNVESNWIIREYLDEMFSFIPDIISDHYYVKFEYIISTSEYDVEVAAFLRDYLKVDGMTYKDVIVFRDKYYMKKFFQKYVKVPNFSLVNNFGDIFSFKNSYGYPFVLKPRNFAGSEGVKIIRNDLDLKKFLSRGYCPNYMIEEYIIGDMYHVDAVMEKGNIVLFSLSKYINNCLSFGQEDTLGSIMIDDDILKYKFKKILEKMLTSYKSKSFIIHAEFFYCNDSIYLCEIGMRMGGGRIRECVKYCSKNDLLEIDIKLQSRMKIEIYKIAKLVGFVLIPNREGVLKSVELAKFPWIVNCYFNQNNIGKRYYKAEASDDFYLSYIIEGKNSTQLEERIKFLSTWQDNKSIWEK